jgi:hypothetical protein
LVWQLEVVAMRFLPYFPFKEEEVACLEDQPLVL